MICFQYCVLTFIFFPQWVCRSKSTVLKPGFLLPYFHHKKGSFTPEMSQRLSPGRAYVLAHLCWARNKIYHENMIIRNKLGPNDGPRVELDNVVQRCAPAKKLPAGRAYMLVRHYSRKGKMYNLWGMAN